MGEMPMPGSTAMKRPSRARKKQRAPRRCDELPRAVSAADLLMRGGIDAIRRRDPGDVDSASSENTRVEHASTDRPPIRKR